MPNFGITFYFFTALSTVLAQCPNKEPFATAERTPTNINENSIKMFITELTIISKNENQTTVNGTIFINAANSFYENSPLKGFISPVVILSNTSSASELRVVYHMNYTYIILNGSNSPNELVNQTIGNFTNVSEGFLNNSEFSSTYNMSSSGFSLESTSLCPSSVCDSNYLECFDDIATVTCRSVCCNSYCLNNGYCHHSDPDVTPICTCPSSSSTWFVGNRCESMLAVWMIVVFFVLIGVIFILILLITFFYCRNIDKKLSKEKQKEYEKMLKIAMKEKEANDKAQALAKEKTSTNKYETERSENVDGLKDSSPKFAGVNPSFSPDMSEDSFAEGPSSSRVSSTGEHKESANESTPASLDRPSRDLPSTTNSGLDCSQRVANEVHDSTSSSSSSSNDNSNTYDNLRRDEPPSYNPPPSYINTTGRPKNLEVPMESTV